jgi:ankyrin repeat protein
VTLNQRFLWAASEGDSAVALRALELGADPKTADALGRNAILRAVRGDGDPELVRRLAEAGVPVDVPENGGRTAYSYAASRGDVAMMRQLESLGAEIDRPDQKNRAPLFFAVVRGRKEAVRHLLEAGVQVDRVDRFGDTPLLAACAKGNDDLARLLIEAGADREHRDQEGRTAADRAAPGAPSCRGETPDPADSP